MKLTKTLLTIVFVCFSVTFFADETVAQCVQCEARTATFACVGSRNRGNSCFTDGGLGCYINGLCNPPNPGGPKPPHQPNQPRMSQEGANACSAGQADKKDKVELEANTIRQIGAVHPRFALALAMLSRNEDFSDYAKIYLRAVNVTQTDVERYLNRETEPSPLSPEEIRRIQSTPAVPETELVIYEVRLVRADDATRGSISLRVLQGAAGDSALNSLEIDLSQIQSGDNQKQWKAIGWRVR
jgi:hypothetical protein